MYQNDCMMTYLIQTETIKWNFSMCKFVVIKATTYMPPYSSNFGAIFAGGQENNISLVPGVIIVKYYSLRRAEFIIWNLQHSKMGNADGIKDVFCNGHAWFSIRVRPPTIKQRHQIWFGGKSDKWIPATYQRHLFHSCQAFIYHSLGCINWGFKA